MNAAAVRYDAVQVAAGAVYWIEGRPDGDVLVRWRTDQGAVEPLPAGDWVGTGIYGYGGGAYHAVGDGVFYSRAADGSLAHSSVRRVTTLVGADEHVWYGDLRWEPPLQALLAVRETTRPGGQVSQLVAAWPGASQPQVLAEGADFFAAPRASPDGRWLAWLTWDQPAMPWDATSLWLAELDPSGRPGPARRVAGDQAESVFCPQWSPEGCLHFVSDRSGWWNLYRHRDGRTEPVALADAEFGVAQWELGYSTYAFLPGGELAVIAQRGPQQQLLIGHPTQLRPLELPYASIKPYLAAAGQRLALITASSTQPPAVATIDTATGQCRELAGGRASAEPAAGVSQPEAFTFPARDGQACYGLYYPPRPAQRRPPLIVRAHPGPAANAALRLDHAVQFFTSRGFAVADVDYRGSTGYGRGYRQQLHRQWGVLDPRDCADAAARLAATGKADPARTVICGASAGGYTALRALLQPGHPFAAATATSAIIDPAAWRQAAPRFQARHADTLIGPWPHAAPTFRARSVLHHAARLRQPVLLIHGTADPITPASHARALADAAQAAGNPCAVLLLPGEGHTLRAAANIDKALHAELNHYQRALKWG